ncbi:MAG: ABC-2 family transporter protein [Gorillibacterium sp.]|nr:ABC-2 family transporter protein [Gorillibacterium sp.]
MEKVARLSSFLRTCWKLNLMGAMEFRFSFLLSAGTMLINNTVWLFFWWIYFNRFQIVNGWEMSDVMMMWAVSAGGFGLMAVFFGNATRLSGMISTGELDVYLSQPKPVLLHILVSRMSISAVGDLLFALIVFVIFGEANLGGLAKFTLALLIGMAVFLGMAILLGTLAFYFGNTEGLSGQLFNSLVSFTIYPTDIFRGVGRILLFTVIPAGFISYLPIKLLKSVDLTFVLSATGFSVGLLVFSVWCFYRGVRRYTSGNMTGLRM